MTTMGFNRILVTRLETFEINQRFSPYDRRKTAPVVEIDSGSWWLFTGLEVHINPHEATLTYTSYADNLKFIKN